MKGLPFNYREEKEKNRESSNFNIYSKQLYLYLLQFGKSNEKYIPRWILDLPTEKLEMFWEAYTFGDSAKNGDGLKISSVSERLILGLQEIALKIGVICQIRYYKYDGWNNGSYYFQFNKNSRNIKYANRKIGNDYKGKVWCITLQTNSVFLVRRNGIITFSGNCLGTNAYASNPSWYIDGDNKKGESELAGKQFFDTDKDFRPAEFMHFCSQMLRKDKPVKEEKSDGGGSRRGAACMILFCPFEQMHYYIELGQRYGLKRYIPLVFRKCFSAQVLKANMKVVGNCEYGLILYRDCLPKFNNNGRMIFNCFDWVRDTDTPKIHPTQKPVPLLERLIEIFTDKGDIVIDPYNRLENEQGRANETQYISNLLDKLTNFAQRHDVLIILMAHPTKMQKNKEGNIEIPNLYDISGSANFYNKADFGIVVHRHRAENTVEVRVQKVKFRHLGETGSAFFRYNLNNGRYTPTTQGNEVDPIWDNSNHLQEEYRRELEEIEEASRLDFPFDNDLPTEDCPF